MNTIVRKRGGGVWLAAQHPASQRASQRTCQHAHLVAVAISHNAPLSLPHSRQHHRFAEFTAVSADTEVQAAAVGVLLIRGAHAEDWVSCCLWVVVLVVVSWKGGGREQASDERRRPPTGLVVVVRWGVGASGG